MRRTRRVGGGGIGTVYSPPLKCLEGDDDKWASPEFISKAIYEGALENEFRNSFLVKEIDPQNNWSLTALHACTINPRQTHTYGEHTHQLIFPNGGQSLYDLLLHGSGDASKYINGLNDAGQEDPTVFQRLHKDGLPKLIDQVKKILPGLKILNTKYVHGDLHFGNIVTDGVNPRIIDFATLQPLEKKIAAEQKLFDKCVKLNENRDCSWINTRLQLLIVDEAKSRDIQTLWSELYSLLDSEWVKKTFPGKYTAWLTKYEDLGRLTDLCPEYALSILDAPV